MNAYNAKREYCFFSTAGPASPARPASPAEPPEAIPVLFAEETTPLEEIVKLERKLLEQQASMKKLHLKWRNEKRVLLRKVKSLGKKAALFDRLIETGVLSHNQVRQATTGRRIRWTADDVSKAVGLRCLTRKGYTFVQRVLKLPLPSASTLSRWTRSFRVTPGVMEAAVSVLEAAVEGMSNLQRLCVITFDEMSLDSRFCLDTSADQVLSGSKLQLLMVRGLCDKWKQPLFYELDAAMTQEKLTHVILRLEALGLSVTAATSDMGSTNEKLWKEAGITEENTCICNPADSSRLVGKGAPLTYHVFTIQGLVSRIVLHLYFFTLVCEYMTP